MADIKIKIFLEGGQFKGEIDGIEKAVDQLEAEVKTSFEDMKSKVTSFAFSFNQITDTAKKIGHYLAEPLRILSDFQTDMANVASLGVENLSELTEGVLEIGQRVPVELGNISKGLYQVVSAGVDASNQLNVLEASAMSAKAGLADTTEALNLGSAIIKSYRKDWSDMTDVMDKAFMTVKLGQTTFGELASNIGVVAPLAATLKVNTEELFGAFATLTGVTGNTAMVATQLRGVMAGLADPTKELSALIKKQTGLTVEQATKQKGLAGVLKLVADATGGSAAKMTKLFGRIEAVNAALALSGAQYDTFIQKTEAMGHASGAMAEALHKQSQTLDAQVQLLKNTLDSIVITVLQRVVPAMNTLLRAGHSVLEWLTNATNSTSALRTELSDLQTKMKQQDEVDTLISKYEALTGKAKRSKDENKKLKDIIQKIAEVFPGAITQVDNYGRALAINIGYVKAATAAQRELLKKTLRNIYLEAKDNVEKYIKKIISLNASLDALRKRTQGYRKEDLIDPVVQYNISVYERQIKSLDKSLKSTNKELDSTLLLMSNFDNVRGKDFAANLAKELNLSSNEAETLNQRLKELFATQKNNANKNPSPVTGNPKKALTVPVKPVIPETFKVDFENDLEDLKFAEPVNVNAFEEQLQHELELNRLFYETGINNEETYQQRKLELLQKGYEQFAQWEGAKSQKALEYLAQRQQAEEEFTKKQEQLAQQQLANFSQLLGQVANAFSGTSRTMFEIGKMAAIAQATINTYQAATKALAEFPPPMSYIAAAAVTAAGMANVLKIERTKFEKKKEGGPLLATQRVLAQGDFGDGENLIFVANDREYLVRSGPAQRYASLLDAINADRPPQEIANLAAIIGQTATEKMASGGAILDNISNPNLDQTTMQRFPTQVNAQIDPRSIEDLREAIQNVRIEIKSELDAIRFYRNTFSKYQQIEEERTVG